MNEESPAYKRGKEVKGWRGPAEVTVPTGVGLWTTFKVRHSRDVDWPLRALDDFEARYPSVAATVRCAEFRNELRELAHQLVTRELATVISESWTDSEIPQWPDSEEVS